jgi:hypothetical protein
LKECDVTGASRLTGTSWDEAWGIMRKAVERGLARKERRLPRFLGIDEKAFAKRHRYETLVCDHERGTVEYVADDRRRESLEPYCRQFSSAELTEIKAIAMDMCEPYIRATEAHVPGAAEKIVFDRFHVIRTVTEAVDKVRRQEHKQLKASGDQRLTSTRHLWLANEEKHPRVAQSGVSAHQGGQPQDRSRLGDQGGVADLVDVPLREAGGGVLPALVLLDDALPADADDSRGQNPATAPAEHPDLLQTSHHQRDRGRTQQQDPDGQGDGLWVPEPRALQDRALLPLRRP